MKRIILLFVVLFIIINFSVSQAIQNKDLIKQSHANIVKKIAFNSQGKYYPLTVLICPYGYWEYGEVRFGYNNYDGFDYLMNYNFEMEVNGLSLETPNNYKFDTIKIDTVYSPFGKIMCFNNELDLDIIDTSYMKEDCKLSSFCSIKDEFKYTYLLKETEFEKDDCETIRCVYPLNVYYPYKTSFAVVELKIFPEKIEMFSRTINTINLLNLKTEEIGNVVLKKKDYKRLVKRLSRTRFNKKIDCSACNSYPNSDFDFVIEYKKNENHYSYFLCKGIYYESLDKNQKEVRDYLLGLYHLVYQLNSNYFGIVRKIK